jgi:hypothetical protein
VLPFVITASGELLEAIPRHETAHTALLTIVPRQASELQSEGCRGCHREIYDDWSQSRHAVAWTNEIFREGFLVEPQTRCIYCHAPLETSPAALKRRPNARALAREGVNCATCHIREQTIYSAAGNVSTSHTASSPHGVTADARLKSPEFCAGCHQFQASNQVNGREVLDSLVVQSTWDEWNAYTASGGTQTCQQCHMPKGRHLFQGAHTLPVLQAAIHVDTTRLPDAVRVTLTATNVGHAVPTGDLFRHITFETKAPTETEWQVRATLGKRHELVVDEDTGYVHQVLAEDSRLFPGKPQTFTIASTGPLQYRLRYHYASPQNEASSHLSPDTLVRTIREDTLP